MGWKALKDAYGINHIVCVTNKCIWGTIENSEKIVR